MIRFDEKNRILIHPGVTDMRKGINGLMAMAKDIRPGDVHVFCSKDRRKVKILEICDSCCYLYEKLVFRSKFQWPSIGDSSCINLDGIMAILNSPDYVTRAELGGKSLNLKAF